jgi:hypothetical protein
LALGAQRTWSAEIESPVAIFGDTWVQLVAPVAKPPPICAVKLNTWRSAPVSKSFAVTASLPTTGGSSVGTVTGDGSALTVRCAENGLLTPVQAAWRALIA